MADYTDQNAIISEKLKILKISSLKAEQKQAVVGLLNGKDVMAILPTGFGKSVIFELFTLVKMFYIDDFQLEVVHQFTYLGSTISDNLSLDAQITKRIGKAATTLGRLTTSVWENPKLTIPTKMAV